MHADLFAQTSRKLFSALLLGVVPATGGMVSVSTVDLANPPGSNNTKAIVDASGALLPPGSGYVAVGTFEGLNDSGIRAAGAAADWTTLLSAFQRFGNAGGVPNFAGVVEHDASAALPADSPFVGKHVYVLVGNTATLGNDPASATQWLVFKSNTVFARDNPVFRAETDLIFATNDQLLVGTLTGATVELTGALAPLGAVPSMRLASSTPSPRRSFQIASILRSPKRNRTTLTWKGIRGEIYSVEYSTNLKKWLTIAAKVPASEDFFKATSFTDTDHTRNAKSAGWYRVVRRRGLGLSQG